MAPSVRFESADVDVSPLGAPLKFEFSGRVAKNRFLKAPMTERMSSWDPKDVASRGVPSKELINLYRRWGEGGHGVIVTGNTFFEPEHLEACGNPIIPKDAPLSGPRFEAFKEMNMEGKKHGCLMITQISHAGRQVWDAIQPHPISASDVQLEKEVMGMHFGKPRPATQEDIDGIVEGFAHTAEYIEACGGDGVQVHAAHGYLLAQFLSSNTNRRTDKYGGSIENRARIIVEIAQAIRKRTRPDFVLCIKLNSTEFQDTNFAAEDVKKLCAILEQNTFDFLEISGGSYEELGFLQNKRASTLKREAYFQEFAEICAPNLTKTKSYLVGGLRTVGAMVKVLDICDGVALGRPTTQEPRIVNDILAGRVKGAIKQLGDPNDYLFNTIAAGMHMVMIGQDKEPLDLSQEANLNAFVADLQAWAGRMAANTDLKLYGWVEQTSGQIVPYGTGEAALT
ncbi:FMN-linked oxidoreductase [Saccharata proteae CBS 121410]|uniref:FMN-linked oxidoreductase n=1 Tax=Saccharata proteae CBS 121410 TaxID=1314787 RepID=A0A9P4LYY3_9PEZI|nr:FMN-linked oxidoreductase [Saccharata proteae CBS 121410]